MPIHLFNMADEFYELVFILFSHCFLFFFYLIIFLLTPKLPATQTERGRSKHAEFRTENGSF